MHEVSYKKGGRLTWIKPEQMHLFRSLEKGESADDEKRLIAKGCVSCRSDLIPFQGAQQEAWEGIFQQQHVCCWEAEMLRNRGLERRTAEQFQPDNVHFFLAACLCCSMGRGLTPSLLRERCGCARGGCVYFPRRNTHSRILERFELEGGNIQRNTRSFVFNIFPFFHYIIKRNLSIHFVITALSIATGSGGTVLGCSSDLRPSGWVAVVRLSA